MTFTYLLENCSEEIISSSIVLPIFYTENGYDLDELDFSPTVNYYWEKVISEENQENYKLTVYVLSTLQDEEDNEIPLYMDLYLYLLNERPSYEFQNFIPKI